MKTCLYFLAFLMAAFPLRAELRTFKNAKGGEIKAELLSATETHAELKREDGKKFSVVLTTLSEEDRKWIAEWRKTHRHYKVQVSAVTKGGNTREEKGENFDGKNRKGNDCWYVLSFKNAGTEALSGLRVEYIVFTPSGAMVPSLCGASDVAPIVGGKTGQALTDKLFVDQAQTVLRSGNSSVVRYSESSLAGIRAELMIDGKPAGTFISGAVPADAEAQLQQWRDKQPKKETPPAVRP